MSKDENARRVTRHERGKAADAVNVNFTRAGDKGIPEIGVRNILESALGFIPTEQDFRWILFKAKYRTSQDGSVFYGIRFGPKKEKKPKSQPASEESHDGQHLTFEGQDLEVTIKGKGVSFKSLIKRVTVWLNLV